MALPTTAAPHHTTTCPHDAAQLPAPPRDAPPSNNHPRPPARIRARRPKAPRTAAGVDPGAPPPSTPRGCWCGSAPTSPPWPTQLHGPPPRSLIPHRRQDPAAPLAYRARRGPLTWLAFSSGKHNGG
ncbi:lysine-rich arabinogalactan protein 19-like isoform X2 [Triticum dicoccoides]|uniref:lysine-rich arabinogalactan protein 19-like isoform X2 n=1 Tax=Triticum dicoccoides TaxID=85692 RepID=UPI00189052A9|nr:lysine-rich arabinogalactan protein 19-like isoform X2 [Triticum dicoccoides]